MAWTTYREQSDQTLAEIVANTEAQMAQIADRPGSERVLAIVRKAHDRAAAELASR